MTVKELHTFTDAEITLIEQALGIAADHYSEHAAAFRRLGEGDGAPRLMRQFEAQSEAARALRLRIEAGR